jgi:hypothetical protein
LLEDYDTNESLSDADFILGKVNIDNTVYYMIRGFPGDEPSGVIYTPTLDEIYEVHWSMESDNKVTDWYLSSLVDGQVPNEWFSVNNKIIK